MTTIDRRTFLTATLASLGAAAAAGQAARDEQTSVPGASAGRIDMHHHFAPPAWIAEVKGRPLLQPANTRWTPEQSIEDMDRGGVAAAVVSITNPGIWFGDAAQTRAAGARLQRVRREARAGSPDAVRLVRRHAAARCRRDAQGDRVRVRHAARPTASACSRATATSWLGNPAFRPVMEELNRRKAVVAVHPTAANCCRNLEYAPGVGPGSMEYGTDTTRAIMGVAFSGDAARFPDIRFIWSHAGGTVPFLAGRIEGAVERREGRAARRLHRRAEEVLLRPGGRRESRGGRVAAAARARHADPVRDRFPSRRHAAPRWQRRSRRSGLFSDADLRAIDRDNAVRLLPRFKT